MSSKFRSTFVCAVTTNIAARLPSPPLLLALAFSATTVCAADDEAVTLRAGAGWSRDSNLFRTADAEQSDTIRQISAGLKINVPVSLQRLTLDGTVDDNHYQNFSKLDYRGGNAKGVWDWTVGDRVSGNLGYRYQRSIADFGDIQSQTRNLITQRTPFLGLKYALTPDWQVLADASRAVTRNSDSTRKQLDNQTNTGAIGINYLTTADNSVGFVVKRSNAKYPNRQAVLQPNGTIGEIDNSFHENQASAIAAWNLSGISRIDAQIGYTNRKHNELSSRNFSGGTGEINYHWAPSAQTTVDVSSYRQVRSSDDLSASYVLFRGIAIAPTWSPLPDTSIKLRVVRELRNYDGDPGFILGTSIRRKDTFQNSTLSVTYAPIKNIELSLAFEAGERESNLDNFDYTYHLTSTQIKASF